ncbi:hypothetical protein DMP23_47485 [Amycolatopsis sp. A1MSW2902]
MSLAERAADAEERQAVLSNSNALFEAPDLDEIDARIAAEKQLRALQLAHRVREDKAAIDQLDREAQRQRSRAEKDAAEEDRRRNEEADIQRWKQRAGDRAEQLTSKSAQLAETAKLLVTAKKAIIAGIILLLAWSGVNVQQQLVPGNELGNPLFWISYALDVTLGGTLVLLMLTSATTARAGMGQRKTLVRGWRVSRYLQEAAILAASLALNSGTHLAHGELLLAAKAAIAPVMVGMLVWAYNHITGQLSTTLLKLTDDLHAHEQLVSDLDAARREIDEQREREEGLRSWLKDVQKTLDTVSAEAHALRAEREARPEVVLDERTLPLLPHALRGFEGMAAGSLTPSIVADGGGVPASTQLASKLGLPKPVAIEVRDLMKKLAKGDTKLVVAEAEAAPAVPLLSRAQ